MHPPTAGDPVPDLPRQERRRAADDRTPQRPPHLAHEAVATPQLPTPHPHQGLEPLVLVVAFLFLLFLAAAEDAAEHVSRAQRDPDTRERVLTDLRLDVVADRAIMVRVPRRSPSRRPPYRPADLALQAALSSIGRARLEPGAETIRRRRLLLPLSGPRPSPSPCPCPSRHASRPLGAGPVGPANLAARFRASAESAGLLRRQVRTTRHAHLLARRGVPRPRTRPGVQVAYPDASDPLIFKALTATDQPREHGRARGRAVGRAKGLSPRPGGSTWGECTPGAERS